MPELPDIVVYLESLNRLLVGATIKSVSDWIERNYCPGYQTEGSILADRSLSTLLKDDWPRSLDELSDS